MHFKKLVMISAALPMIALGGCSTSGTLQTTISTVEAEVQSDANVLCGFIPTVATIAALIPGFGSAAASSATIAQAVCSAVASAPVVTPKSAGLRAGLAASGADVQVTTMSTPNGPVAVVGHFTR